MLVNLFKQEEQYFTRKYILNLVHINIEQENIAYMIPYSGSLQLFSVVLDSAIQKKSMNSDTTSSSSKELHGHVVDIIQPAAL